MPINSLHHLLNKMADSDIKRATREMKSNFSAIEENLISESVTKELELLKGKF